LSSPFRAQVFSRPLKISTKKSLSFPALRYKPQRSKKDIYISVSVFVSVSVSVSVWQGMYSSVIDRAGFAAASAAAVAALVCKKCLMHRLKIQYFCWLVAHKFCNIKRKSFTLFQISFHKPRKFLYNIQEQKPRVITTRGHHSA